MIRDLLYTHPDLTRIICQKRAPLYYRASDTHRLPRTDMTGRTQNFNGVLKAACVSPVSFHEIITSVFFGGWQPMAACWKICFPLFPFRTVSQPPIHVSLGADVISLPTPVRRHIFCFKATPITCLIACGGVVRDQYNVSTCISTCIEQPSIYRPQLHPLIIV